MPDHPPYAPEAEDAIEVNLLSLYRAGKIDLPARADAVAGAATETRTLVDEVNVRAGMTGDPAVLQDVIEIVAQVHNALVRSAETLRDCGAGLIYVVQDFAARDDFARGELATIQQTVDNEVAGLPAHPTVPIPEEADIPDLQGAGFGEGALDTPPSTEDDKSDRDDGLAEDLESTTPPEVELP